MRTEQEIKDLLAKARRVHAYYFKLMQNPPLTCEHQELPDYEGCRNEAEAFAAGLEFALGNESTKFLENFKEIEDNV
jgi:hypothetical protein